MSPHFACGHFRAHGLQGVVDLSQQSLGWLFEDNLDFLSRGIRAHAQHARLSKNLPGGAVQEIRIPIFWQREPHHTHLGYMRRVNHVPTLLSCDLASQNRATGS
jgi:hypothetical protein